MTALPSGAEHDGTAAAWLGAIARVLAFAALVVLIGLPLGALAGRVFPAGILAGAVVTTVAAVAAGAALLRYADGRPVAALGLGLSRQTVPHLGWGLGIGVVALLAAAGAMLASGSLRYVAEPGTVGGWAAAVLAQAGFFAVAALAEEALFRGYPFQVLVRATGPVLATLATSALFAVAHAGNPDVGAFALLNIFLAGVLLAVAYLRTLSLWFATALHMGWNWAMASLLDLPVSGLRVFDTPGYQPVVGGPDPWSGGAFGPEGGVVGTLGFGVAIVAVLRLRWLRPDARIAAAAPLVLDRRGRGHDG